MRPILGLLLSALALDAATVVNGGVLLNQADANQIAIWLGEGDLTLTNIYSGTPTTGASTNWHAAVDGVGRTVSLILTDLGLIGGYNPVSWNSTNTWTFSPTDAERTAFIFNLTSGVLQAQRLGAVDGQFQTFNAGSYGPVFGKGNDIWVLADMSSGYAVGRSYGVGTTTLFGAVGGTSVFNVLRVETFTIANGGDGVPEPTTCLLFGTAVIALGFAHRTSASSRRRRN